MFVRPGPEHTARGKIERKGYLAGGTFRQFPVEVNRGFRQPHEVPVAESCTFELRLEGLDGLVRASFNTVKSRVFEPGQQVLVRYVQRGIPGVWHRITVVDMTPADSS